MKGWIVGARCNRFIPLGGYEMAQKSYRKVSGAGSLRMGSRSQGADFHPLMEKDIHLFVDLIEVLFEDYSPKNLSFYQLIHLIERETLVRILARFKGDYQESADYLGMGPLALRRIIAEGEYPPDFKITKE